MAILLPLLLALLGFPLLVEGATRVEQDDPSIIYSGNWYTNESDLHSGGTAALTNARGARATITFTGTGITWLGVADGWSGLATLYFDGAMTVVDSYDANGRYQHPLYTARGLPAGTHTLSIEVTHERDANTEGSWVWIDAFEVENGAPVPGGATAGAGRIEESNPALTFTGKWFANPGESHSGGNSALSTDAGSRARVTFSGTGISWIANRDEWSGIARIYLDGELKTEIDTYLSPAQPRAVPYTIGGLGFGTHTLAIEVTGSRSESAKGSWVWIDAFDVTP
jgi:hypothetical protein